MRTTGTITTPNGITWYYEQEGSGPDIILIPDGLGESAVFSHVLPLIAGHGFRATTFDMPGMSRSSAAPAETYTNITAQKLAGYVIGVLDALDIRGPSTFWGCSSAGSTVLALVAGHADRVRNAMAHEVPTYPIAALNALSSLSDDDAIAAQLAASLPAQSCGDLDAWEALGPEVHARLWKNYPRWARGYPRTLPQSSPTGVADVTKRPLFWTVGASTKNAMFFDNIVSAVKAGVEVACLPGMHFPYVSDPEAFVKHVVEQTRRHL